MSITEVERKVRGSAFSFIPEEISTLQVEKKENTLVAQAKTPQEFFEKFEVEDLKFFNPESIQQLYSLMEKHILTNSITFHDLFGLEFDSLFDQLRGHLNLFKVQELRERWRKTFFKGFYGLMRMSQRSEKEITDTTRTVFLLPKAYAKEMSDLTKELEGLYQNTLKSYQKSPALQKQLQKTAGKVLEEWDQSRILLGRFLMHPSGDHLIAGLPIYHCPGTQNMMVPKGPEEVKVVIKSLARYVDLIVSEMGSYKKSSVFYIPEFFEIQKRVQELTQEESSESILDKAEKILQYLNQLDLGSRLGCFIGPLEEWENSYQYFIALHTSWVLDIRNVLEASIIRVLRPSTPFTAAYLNRLMFNLGECFPILNKDKDSLSELEKDCHSLVLEKRGEIEALLGTFRLTKGATSNVARPELEDILDKVERAVNSGFKRAKDLSEQRGDLSMEEVQWISRLFILKHDLKVLLGKGSHTEENVFPEEFLLLFIKEESPASVEEDIGQNNLENRELDEETCPIPDSSGYLDISSEEKVPVQSAENLSADNLQDREFSEENFSSESAKENENFAPSWVQPKMDSLIIAAPQKSFDAILDSRKRRHVEKVLRNLGMEPIRVKGSHHIWEGEGLQVVVPAHDEIAKGTLHSIYKQLQEQSDRKS